MPAILNSHLSTSGLRRSSRLSRSSGGPPPAVIAEEDGTEAPASASRRLPTRTSGRSAMATSIVLPAVGPLPQLSPVASKRRRPAGTKSDGISRSAPRGTNPEAALPLLHVPLSFSNFTTCPES